MQVDIIATGSSGNAYRISDGRTALLLDAGIPIKKIQQNIGFEISELSGCLITHCHGDHSKACKDIAKYGVNIYSSEGTFGQLGLVGHRYKNVYSLKQFKIGTFDVLPFEVIHDAPEPLGYLIYSNNTKEKLVYFTDTCSVNYIFDGITHILGECNYDESTLEDAVLSDRTDVAAIRRLRSTHMGLQAFLDFISINTLTSVKVVYILHLSDRNASEEIIRNAISERISAEIHIC